MQNVAERRIRSLDAYVFDFSINLTIFNDLDPALSVLILFLLVVSMETLNISLLPA